MANTTTNNRGTETGMTTGTENRAVYFQMLGKRYSGIMAAHGIVFTAGEEDIMVSKSVMIKAGTVTLSLAYNGEVITEYNMNIDMGSYGKINHGHKDGKFFFNADMKEGKEIVCKEDLEVKVLYGECSMDVVLGVLMNYDDEFAVEAILSAMGGKFSNEITDSEAEEIFNDALGEYVREIVENIDPMVKHLIKHNEAATMDIMETTMELAAEREKSDIEYLDLAEEKAHLEETVNKYIDCINDLRIEKDKKIAELELKITELEHGLAEYGILCDDDECDSAGLDKGLSDMLFVSEADVDARLLENIGEDERVALLKAKEVFENSKGRDKYTAEESDIICEADGVMKKDIMDGYEV